MRIGFVFVLFFVVFDVFIFIVVDVEYGCLVEVFERCRKSNVRGLIMERKRDGIVFKIYSDIFLEC